jgi:hypothetical protein
MLRNFREPFVREAKLILAAHPELRHEWHNRGREAKLIFPPATPDGFEVWALASDTELIVGGEGAHHHFEYDDCPLDGAIGAALGLLLDLLSPGMRLREYSAGGSPYCWVLESRCGEGWRAEEETGTLFYNWFAQRSERVRQNRQLPPREIAG